MSDADTLSSMLIIQARNVRMQLATCLALLSEDHFPGPKKVEDQDRVLNHLSRTFEDRFYTYVFSGSVADDDKRRARSFLHVSRLLEEIGDLVVEMAKIRQSAGDGSFDAELLDLGQKSLRTLTASLESFFQESIPLAKKACELCLGLEELCQDKILEGMGGDDGGGPPDAPIPASQVLQVQCLRGILLSQLKVAESTIYRVSGERLSFSQYMHLERLAKEAGARTGCFAFKNLWGGISGAVVGRLDLGEKGQWVFKDGISKKILPEVENLKRWGEVLDGLVPRLAAVGSEKGDTISFLSEFVEGELLSDIFLHGVWEEKVEALEHLLQTLRQVWQTTLIREQPAMTYVKQINDRLPAVFAQHPRLKKIRQTGFAIAGTTAPSLKEQLRRAAADEQSLAPPFSVMLHGDFNANNILYNRKTGAIRFIDIHRSKPGDMVQDLGVFLVSGVRSPLVKLTVLEEMLRLNEMTEQYAHRFAKAHGDAHFDRRLMLSRARSFITSSRLISDFRFAKELFLEGLYHLDRFCEGVTT